MYTRRDCHLCDDARVVVQQVCAAAGVDVHEVDVDSDPELAARYGDEVPVVTVDGEVVGFWRISPQAVREALR